MSILSWLFGSRLDTPGVYCIRNRKNGRVYIGSTQRTIRVRLQEHTTRLHNGTHPNIFLQSDWDQYGRHTFAFEVMENTDPNQAEERELYWQLRTPRQLLYARLADPPSARELRKQQREQRYEDLISMLVSSDLSDDDLNRLFKAHVVATVTERKRALGL